MWFFYEVLRDVYESPQSPSIAHSGGTETRPGPPDPSLHVHLKRGGVLWPPPLLLVKPRCFLHEVRNRLPGHRQPRRAEMIAQEVESPLDPPDEGLIRVLLQTQGVKHLVQRLYPSLNRPRNTRPNVRFWL